MSRKTDICNHQARYHLQIYARLDILGREIGTCNCQVMYRLQVYIKFNILDAKTCIYDQPGFRYTLGFIFQVEKQILATVMLYTYCKYLSDFIFWMKKQIPAIGQVLDIW